MGAEFHLLKLEPGRVELHVNNPVFIAANKWAAMAWFPLPDQVVPKRSSPEPYPRCCIAFEINPAGVFGGIDQDQLFANSRKCPAPDAPRTSSPETAGKAGFVRPARSLTRGFAASTRPNHR